MVYYHLLDWCLFFFLLSWFYEFDFFPILNLLFTNFQYDLWSFSTICMFKPLFVLYKFVSTIFWIWNHFCIIFFYQGLLIQSHFGKGLLVYYHFTVFVYLVAPFLPRTSSSFICLTLSFFLTNNTLARSPCFIFLFFLKTLIHWKEIETREKLISGLLFEKVDWCRGKR